VPSATWQDALRRAYTTVIMGHFMSKESIAPVWGALDPLLNLPADVLADEPTDEN